MAAFCPFNNCWLDAIGIVLIAGGFSPGGLPGAADVFLLLLILDYDILNLRLMIDYFILLDNEKQLTRSVAEIL